VMIAQRSRWHCHVSRV